MLNAHSIVVNCDYVMENYTKTNTYIMRLFFFFTLFPIINKHDVHFVCESPTQKDLSLLCDVYKYEQFLSWFTILLWHCLATGCLI